MVGIRVGLLDFGRSFGHSEALPGRQRSLKRQKKLCRSKFSKTSLFPGFRVGGGKNCPPQKRPFWDIFNETPPYAKKWNIQKKLNPKISDFAGFSGFSGGPKPNKIPRRLRRRDFTPFWCISHQNSSELGGLVLVCPRIPPPMYTTFPKSGARFRETKLSKYGDSAFLYIQKRLSDGVQMKCG